MFSRIRSWLRRDRSADDYYDDGAPHVVVHAHHDAKPAVAPRLPRFGGLANDLEDPALPSPAQASSRRRLGRAFPLSQPIADLRQFAGRRDLLATVIRSIEEQRLHVVLYGDRGIGKTSLLHIITLLAQDARYQVRYTSCSQSSDFDSTFRSIARDVPLLYHSKADPTSDQVASGKTLADLLDDRKITPSYFSEVLEGISGTRLLIILDEFDRADSLDFRRQVAELIKNLSDRSTRVQLLIGGVAANLTELIQHIPSIRRNLLGIPVAKMNDEEIAEIISNGEWISALQFDAGARRKITDAANGSPYLANLIAHQASSRAIDRRATEVLESDVAASVAGIAADLVLRLDDPARAQMHVLREAVPAAQLREIARHALDNFGRVTAADGHQLGELIRKEAKRAPWLNDAGEFEFLDDSMPLTLWMLLSAELGSTASPALVKAVGS